MNKKLIMMTTSLAVGGILLFGTALANASQLSGYETYKQSILSIKDLKNGTAIIKASVYDNGSDLLDVSSNVKINLNANTLSEATTIKSGSTTQTSSIYRQDGKTIQKFSDSDLYTVRENMHKNNNELKKTESPELTKAVETLVDTLVGNMQNDVAVTENNDGTKKVAVNIKENEVTPLINAATSVVAVSSTNPAFHNEKLGKFDLKSIFPQLVSDVKIKSIDVNGDINKDNVIKDQIAKVVISGSDAQGKNHEITININVDLSNINSTTPDTVDLTGKQVKTITTDFRGEH